MGFTVEEYGTLQSQYGVEGFSESIENGEYIDINQIIIDYFPSINMEQEKALTLIIEKALIISSECIEQQSGEDLISLQPVREAIKKETIEFSKINGFELNIGMTLKTLFNTHMKILKFFGFDFVSPAGYMFRVRG